MAGRGTPATVLLQRERVPFRLHAYEHRALADGRARYGAEAAAALGVDQARIFTSRAASPP